MLLLGERRRGREGWQGRGGRWECVGQPGRQRGGGKNAAWTFPGWEIYRRVRGEEQRAVHALKSNVQKVLKGEKHNKEANGGCLVTAERG